MYDDQDYELVKRGVEAQERIGDLLADLNLTLKGVEENIDTTNDRLGYVIDRLSDIAIK